MTERLLDLLKEEEQLLKNRDLVFGNKYLSGIAKEYTINEIDEQLNNVYDEIDKINRELLIQKNRKQAADNRARLAEFERSHHIAEMERFLAHVINPIDGVPRWSKEELSSMTGDEIEAWYNDINLYQPELAKSVRESILKEKEAERAVKEKTSNKSKRLKPADIPRLTRKTKDDSIEETELEIKQEEEKEEVERNIIIKNEDGSRFTIVDKFKKHWKKVLGAAALIGAAALAGYYIYQQLKQGQADQAIETINNLNPDGIVDTVQDKIADLTSTNVTPVNEVYSNIYDTMAQTNSVEPNEWFRWNIIDALDKDGNAFNVTTKGDIQALIDKGIDIVGVRTGDASIADPTKMYSGYVPIEDVLTQTGGAIR